MKTQIKFGTDGWRAEIAADFTFENLGLVTQALVEHLLEQDTAKKGIAVGYDNRFQSESFAKLAAEICSGAGIKTYLSDKSVPSQVTSFTVKNRDLAAGIMITASHNPKEYNGFKLRGRGDIPILGGTGLEKIVALTQRTHVKSTAPKGSVLLCKDYRDDYVKFLGHGITIPNRLRVVVDAAGGATSLFLPRLLSRFSNFIYKPLFFEPDGSFKRHLPNPFLPDAQVYAKEELKSDGFNFGVIFDGDGDRIVFLDEKGGFVHPDYIAALLAEEELKTKPGSWFVFTANTSKNAWEYIQERGGKIRISRVGYVFMQGAMKKTSALIGSEISGHYCFKDFFNDDSALLAFLRLADLLSRTKRPLSQLIKAVERYVTSEEMNFSVQDKGTVLKRVQDFYQDGKISRLDGISVDFPDWWFNLRPSNTEPYIRLVMEAKTQEMYDEKMKELERIIGKR